MTPSTDDLRALVRYLEDRLEAERASVARTLHDDMAQGITAIRFGLERVADGLGSGAAPDRLAEETRSAIGRLEDLMRAIRRTMAELRPPVLDQVGLRAALQWRLRGFEQRTGIAVELDAPAEPGLSGVQATRVYRVVSDELTRLEHGGSAALVCVTLHHDPGHCRIELAAHDYVPPPGDPRQALVELQFRERALELGDRGTIERRGSTRVVTFGVPLAAAGEPA